MNFWDWIKNMIKILSSTGSHPPPPPPPPPPPGQLHAPTFNPNGSLVSSTNCELNCVDAGAHIFYTLGSNPPPPTHVGDSPTGTTQRIGSNDGIVNSGIGQTRFKALSYKSGFTDSDVSSSGTFGVPVTLIKPIPTGFFQLTDTDYNFVNDPKHYQGWTLPYCDGFRLRTTWAAVEPNTHGTYVWTQIDAAVAKALSTGRFLTVNIAAGNNTPAWVYGSPYNAQQVTISDGGTMPLAWDTRYTNLYFAMINAFAEHVSTLPGGDQIRLIFDAGWMPKVTLAIGGPTDEDTLIATLPAYGYTADHTGLTSAYLASGLAVAAAWFSAFPNIGHVTTGNPVFQDTYGKALRTQFLNAYHAAQLNRNGDMNTSAFAFIAPHAPPDPAHLSSGPQCAQEVHPMTLPDGTTNGASYSPANPVPLPDPVTAIQDACETRWTLGNSYFEIYQPDMEYAGITDMMLFERTKVKSNLLPP